jgi:hypothetical protein
MLNMSKQKKQPEDIKTLRSDILDFIKKQLRKAGSGEGGGIRGLHLYINCPPEIKFMYESAVYIEQEDGCRDDIQKIADDFAIDLPAGWFLKIAVDEPTPPEAIASPDLDLSLFISTRRKPSIHQEATAYLKILNGEAEQGSYTLHSSMKKINIGREKNVQVAKGFMRVNQVAFPDSSGHKSNKSISRQHAHIEWNEDSASFYLFADEGGIPPYNKVKIKPEQGNEVRLVTTEVGHQLKEGDQVMLGESALMLFSFLDK